MSNNSQWPEGNKSCGQEMECDPILGCQPINRAAFDRMMRPVGQAWIEATQELIEKLLNNPDNAQG